MKREINTVDLFCGAGGATTGLELALHRLGMTHHGIAINHWEIAVDTMKKNHPLIDTKRMSIEEAVPADLVKNGEVDLLWASPSCTHHSRAAGGKPRSNQLRAQPELVLTWLDQLFVRRLIVENVPEFQDWGPLTKDGTPIKAAVGNCFRAWVAALEARNYTVEWRIVNCADYGDATTRRRFFLKAVRKGCGKIVWPEPTHAENPTPDLFGQKKPWRGIRECIDFADTGHSIFDRKKPLADNTLRRIAAGLNKFCGMDVDLNMLKGCGKRRPLKKSQRKADGMSPFIVKLRNHGTADSIASPISTVTCSGAHHAICQALILDHFQGGTAQTADRPIGAQTTHDRFSVVTPMVLGQQGGAQCQPVDRPCPTVATKGAIRMITPLIVEHQRNGKAQPPQSPIGTITTHDKFSLVTPFVVDNANGGVQVDPKRPLNTVTTKDNHMLVSPLVLEDGRMVDIRIRMLKPEELAAAHSFPTDYVLTGNRSEQVKQIGNSVPVMTAAAMCQVDFDERDEKGRAA